MGSKKSIDETDNVIEATRYPEEIWQLGSMNLCRLGNFWFPEFMIPTYDKFAFIENLAMRDDDVLVCTFCKTGTGWLQYIAWLIVNVDTDSRNSDACDQNIEQRVPFLECLFPGVDVSQMASPRRVLKTHVPYDLLPQEARRGKGKILYLVRNAKDVCVSFDYFIRLQRISKFKGTFQEFIDIFCDGRVLFGPYPNHVASYMKHRKDANMFIIQYEHLKENPAKVISQIAQFMGRPLSTEQLSEVVRLSQFDVVKNDPLINYSWAHYLEMTEADMTPFFRKGIVGDWKNRLTPEQEQQIYKACIEPLEKMGVTYSGEHHVISSDDIDSKN
jgi:hypothetical protein